MPFVTKDFLNNDLEQNTIILPFSASNDTWHNINVWYNDIQSTLQRYPPLEIKIFQNQQKGDTVVVLPTPWLHNRRAMSFNVIKSLSIALFVVSGSIKKLFSVACGNIYFSQSTIFSNIYLFSIFFSIHFTRWKSVGLPHIACHDLLTLNKNVLFVWKYQVRLKFERPTNFSTFVCSAKIGGGGVKFLTAKSAKLAQNILRTFLKFPYWKIVTVWAFPEKKQTGGVEDIHFWKYLRNFLHFNFTCWNLWT